MYVLSYVRVGKGRLYYVEVVSDTDLSNLAKTGFCTLRIKWHGLCKHHEQCILDHRSHATMPTMHYACIFCSCTRLALYMEVKVVNIIYPSCVIMQMQGACGVRALSGLDIIIIASYVIHMDAHMQYTYFLWGGGWWEVLSGWIQCFDLSPMHVQ